jgi:predicted Zn-dependent peptidase
VAPQKPALAVERSGSRLIVGDRPGETQVTLEVGCVLPEARATSAAVEDVLVNLLGAKLDDDLRQRTGATYGVHVWLERLRGGTSVLHARSAIGNEMLGPSFKTFYASFAGDEALVDEDSLKIARFDALEAHIVHTETSADLANEIFEYARRGLSTTDLGEHPKRIAKVDLEATRRLLDTCRKTSLFSAVGNEASIRAAWHSPK